MPTKMGSGIGSKLQVASEKLRNLSLLVTFYLSLATSARERISVFTCATDDCPRCAPWRDGEAGCYFLMPNRSITAR
jgi:hypothetical protein